MNDNQLYANGRVAVLSSKLFSQDKFLRLSDCNTVAEALKLLAENGYANAITAEFDDYETVLRDELDAALALLKELCYDVNALNFVLSKYDYLNAKALMKCKYMRVDGISYCYGEASVAPQDMQRAIVSDDYSGFTKNMAEACDAIDSVYAEGKRSPQIIDVYLDRAMYADLRVYAKKSSLKALKDMYAFDVDTTNLTLLYRVKKANLSAEVFADSILEGGEISRETLLKLWDNEQYCVDLPSRYKSFFELCKADNADLSRAEEERKAETFKFITDNADLLSVQPVLEYFYKKVNEIEKVRRLLIGVKNGADKDSLKDILK